MGFSVRAGHQDLRELPQSCVGTHRPVAIQLLFSEGLILHEPVSLGFSIHLLSEFPCLEPCSVPFLEDYDVQGNREAPREPCTEALLQNNHPLNTRLLSPPKPACFVHFGSCIRIS